jgi:CheY-like chemotaxis protein
MHTLLIVEDEPVLRASMVRGLAKLPGLEIVDAGTKAEATALLSAMPPDLMISDLDLPDGSGVELLAELDRRALRIPVLFVSAHLRRYRVPQRPGLEMLEKPVPLSRLREIVTTRLGSARDSGPAFGLTDYVQLAGLGRRSVKLTLLRDGTRLGEVLIRDGEAWHAGDEQGTGVAAFRRLVLATDVLVEAESIRPEGPRTLNGSCEHVLLEAARIEDEQRRDGVDVELEWEPEPARSERPSFEQLYEDGVEALLDKRYDDAFAAFTRARGLATTPSLEANLQRLKVLGYGT